MAGALIAFSGAALLLLPTLNGSFGAVSGYGWHARLLLGAVPGLGRQHRFFNVAAAFTIMACAICGKPYWKAASTRSEALLAGIALGLGPYGIAMVAWDKALRFGKQA